MDYRALAHSLHRWRVHLPQKAVFLQPVVVRVFISGGGIVSVHHHVVPNAIDDGGQVRGIDSLRYDDVALLVHML